MIDYNILSLEEYKNYYYKYNKTIDQIQVSNQKLLDKQLNSRYNKYIIKENRKLNKKESDYSLGVKEIAERVKRKDPIAYLFFSRITVEEKLIVLDEIKRLRIDRYEVAHIISRNESRYLADKEENMIVLPYIVHRYLDQFINPFTKKRMTNEEHELLWRRIVTDKVYDKLKNMKLNKSSID